MTHQFKTVEDIGYVLALGDSLFIDECLEVRHHIGSTYTFLDRSKAEALKVQAEVKYKGLELRVMQVTRTDVFTNATFIGRVYDPNHPEHIYDQYANGELYLNGKLVENDTWGNHLIPYTDKG